MFCVHKNIIFKRAITLAFCGVILTASSLAWSDDSLNSISNRIAAVRSVAENELETSDVYVSGSSALSLLDSVYKDLPLQLEEIDMIVVAHKKVSEDAVKKFRNACVRSTSQQLDQAGVVWPQYRNENNYLAGYDFDLRRLHSPKLDIEVVHMDSDRKLNGAFNTEKVFIKIPQGETLETLVDMLKKNGSYENNVSAGLILDDDHGYPAWRDKNPEIVDWAPIQKNPVNWILRAARTYARVGADRIPEPISRKLRELASKQTDVDRIQISKNIQLNLNSPTFATELKMISSAGGLSAYSKSIQKWVATHSVQEIESRLGSNNSGFARLNTLIEQVEPDDQRRLTALIPKNITNTNADRRPAESLNDPKTEIVRKIRNAAQEIGGDLGNRYDKILLPFLETYGQVAKLPTGPNSYVSTLSVSPTGAKETSVILVGKGDSWVEDLELIYDQFKQGRKVFIFDQEGQGLSSRSGGNPNVTHISHFSDYTNDLATFMEKVVKPEAVGPIHMITHSTGGTIGQTYLIDHPDVFKDAVHIAPLFKILFPNHLNNVTAKILATFDTLKNGADSAVQKFPIEPTPLPGERPKFRWALNRAFSDTGGVIEPASARWVSEIINATKTLKKRAAEAKTPFLIIQAGKDQTVDNTAQNEIVRASRPEVARLRQLPTLEHNFLYQDDTSLATVLTTLNDYLAETDHGIAPSMSAVPVKSCLLSRVRSWIAL